MVAKAPGRVLGVGHRVLLSCVHVCVCVEPVPCSHRAEESHSQRNSGAYLKMLENLASVDGHAWERLEVFFFLFCFVLLEVCCEGQTQHGGDTGGKAAIGVPAGR